MQSSMRLRDLGVIQYGAPLLRESTQTVCLPDDKAATERVVDQLFAVLDPVSRITTFPQGLALAAPQIGIARAVAVVLPAGHGGQAIVLTNPRITTRSPEVDEQYERCLSFFDVQGMVPRHHTITVETHDLDGTLTTQQYQGAAARLIQHAIDHLDGLLYPSRMRPGVEPTPVLPPGRPSQDHPEDTWSGGGCRSH